MFSVHAKQCGVCMGVESVAHFFPCFIHKKGAPVILEWLGSALFLLLGNASSYSMQHTGTSEIYIFFPLAEYSDILFL